MNFSMNGFRRNLSADVETLRGITEQILKGNHYDEAQLCEAMNDVICKTNALQCVYNNDDPDFADQSHIAVETLDLDELRHNVEDW